MYYSVATVTVMICLSPCFNISPLLALQVYKTYSIYRHT